MHRGTQTSSNHCKTQHLFAKGLFIAGHYLIQRKLFKENYEETWVTTISKLNKKTQSQAQKGSNDNTAEKRGRKGIEFLLANIILTTFSNSALRL